MMIRGKHALDGLDQDIREHIERETQDNIDRGMTPQEAHRQAMFKFGSIALAKEDTRAVWVWPRLDEMRQDISYGFRVLRRNPSFAFVTIALLALGIGATVAIFTVLEGVLLRPLPYDHPERIVRLWESNPERGFERFEVLPGSFLDWRERSTAFEALAFYRVLSASLRKPVRAQSGPGFGQGRSPRNSWMPRSTHRSTLAWPAGVGMRCPQDWHS